MKQHSKSLYNLGKHCWIDGEGFWIEGLKRSKKRKAASDSKQQQILKGQSQVGITEIAQSKSNNLKICRTNKFHKNTNRKGKIVDKEFQITPVKKLTKKQSENVRKAV